MRGTPIGPMVVLVAALLGETAAFGVSRAAARQRTLEPLDIRGAPSQADWRYFLKAPEGEREKLWTYHEGRGQKLGAWSWGWRLGWIRACAASERPYCHGILQAALFDKALVVRAEAATRYGRRFEGSADAEAVALLAKAYANPRNLRGGKPLFVQSRILFALRRIGGDGALAAGQRLAAAHPEAKTYWTRLMAVE